MPSWQRMHRLVPPPCEEEGCLELAFLFFGQGSYCVRHMTPAFLRRSCFVRVQMKFGKRLKQAAVFGWEPSYVNYAYLKAKIKALAAAALASADGGSGLGKARGTSQSHRLPRDNDAVDEWRESHRCCPRPHR